MGGGVRAAERGCKGRAKGVSAARAVKGAYNGVYAPRLIQRIRVRRIPERQLRWIWAFCSQRLASLFLNRHESDVKELPFPGLPQGSPLSLVLFLFYNADLVERKILNREEAIAFVDNYIAWVVGRSIESNLSGIREVVNHALAWERRSGATFEGEKTTLVYFIRNAKKQSTTPINIKGVDVALRNEIKVLGVILDSALRFKNHIKNALIKGLKAVLTLR